MSNNIANYRRFLGMTQEELAEKLKVSTVTIYKYEHMKDLSNLKEKTLYRILEIFNKNLGKHGLKLSIQRLIGDK